MNIIENSTNNPLPSLTLTKLKILDTAFIENLIENEYKAREAVDWEKVFWRACGV